MGNGALSLGVKRPWREADHSPPPSAEVKEWVEIYLHFPNTPSWRGAQLKKKAQGELYLYLLLREKTCKDEGYNRFLAGSNGGLCDDVELVGFITSENYQYLMERHVRRSVNSVTYGV
jgi:hypothetical protein